MKKVAVGLSGGVDSAVSAALLKEQGYDVTGVFLECWRGSGCRVNEDRKDAMDVALKLGIPFKVLDFKEAYKKKVVDYFYREYAAGRTPNPDTMCNREIKFGMFYNWAMKEGYDFVATGHYARIHEIREIPNDKFQISNKFQRSNDKYQLLKGVDEKKDQSYFLYQLRGAQLGHILFPIGGMTKNGVRTRAKELKMPVAEKPDSQGICFIGEVSIKQFLKELGMKEKEGKVFLKETRNKKQETNKFQNTINNYQMGERSGLVEIGTHNGAWFYTIGQRHGFKIQDLRFKNEEQKREFESRFDLTNMPPLYVLEKDSERNMLIVGTREQAMRGGFEVEYIHWVNQETRSKLQETNNSPTTNFNLQTKDGEDEQALNLVQNDKNLKVRIRHGGALVPVKEILRLSGGADTTRIAQDDTLDLRSVSSVSNKERLMVWLVDPVFGVAPGQACVFYLNEVCLGGGVIG